MSSFYRSDVSQSTRASKSITGSETSAVRRPTKARQVTQLSAVTGNRASGNSLQINGNVAEKASSYNIERVVISCHCDIAKALATIGSAFPLSASTFQLPASAPTQPRLPGPARRTTPFDVVIKPEIASLLKAKQDIPIVSNWSGRPDKICVMFPPKLRNNFVSRDVIDRLGFAARLVTATVSSLIWDSKCYTSTGEYVELSFPLPGSAEGAARRFLVLDNPPFDMLLSAPATCLPPLKNRRALLK